MGSDFAHAAVCLDLAAQQLRWCWWGGLGLVLQIVLLLLGEAVLRRPITMTDLVTAAPFLLACVGCFLLSARNHRKTGKILGFVR